MRSISDKVKWPVAVGVFGLCIGPTFIGYRPYVFRWDDSGYLQKSIAVSRAFWTGNANAIAHLRQVTAAMYSFRPPAMTLLGLPWGPLLSWDAAGKCFLTLAVLISFLAAFSLFLLARIGIRPELLALASVCVFASFGPVPPGARSNYLATAFMADDLFSWIALAALLLIPYEARTNSLSPRHAFFRGLVWGVVLSAGAMTKISFLYFVVLVVPILLVIRFRRSGWPSTFAALAGAACSSAPAVAYLVKYGAASFANGEESSFGRVANFYNLALLQFLHDNLRHAPGLVFFLVFVASSLCYLFIKGFTFLREPEFPAFLIACGFGIIVLASVNRELRFMFPVILALPFLLGILVSGRGKPLARKPAALVACLVFCSFALAALPTRHRADRQSSLGRSDAVLAQAIKCNDKQIVLATDSPTLNELLMDLSAEVTRTPSSIEIHTLVNSAVNNVPVESDFRVMQASDLVIFQDDDALSPPFTNSRVPEYRRFIGQQSEESSMSVWSDVSAYSRHCRP